MKFIRNLPEMWARTSWPLSNSTRNIALGSGSVTLPSTSITSFFGTDSPASHANSASRCLRDNHRLYHVRAHRSQYNRPILSNGDGVLVVSGHRTVNRDDRPV